MRAIMIQGTSSDVGKSLICTALCRIFAKDGHKVAPFKSQNMAQNSYVTKDGAEISSAQGLQAEAANTCAMAEMNPILIKPKGNMTSQVLLGGKHFADMSVMYYKEEFLAVALSTIRTSLATLAQHYDVLIVEGAGSPVEMNFKEQDIVNMAMARETNAAVILVADIERGGAFASIVGTLALLTEQERARIKGIIINKFHGEQALFTDGVEWLEAYTGIPVLGVIPHIATHLEAEDSLSGQQLKEPMTEQNRSDREKTYEELAAHVREHVDMSKVYALLTNGSF